jgi:methylmalonyl-CoA mutase cobalamin-binding subunit
MLSIYSERKSATLLIPAAYLHDVRAAIIDQCVQDSDDLRCDHGAVLNANEEIVQAAAKDRASVLRRMNENVSVLNQVFDAEGDTTITDTAEKLADTLGVMNRLLTERLTAGCVPEEEPAELLRRLDEMRWAAEEAIRLDPRVVFHG